MNEAADITELLLSTAAFRMQCRVDACLERNGGDEQAAITSSGVGISYLFASEIARTCDRAAEQIATANAEIERVKDANTRLDVQAGELVRTSHRVMTENERLKALLATCVEALGLMIYETTHLSAMKDNGSHDCNISKYALEKGRAARDAAKAGGSDGTKSS